MDDKKVKMKGSKLLGTAIQGDHSSHGISSSSSVSSSSVMTSRRAGFERLVGKGNANTANLSWVISYSLLLGSVASKNPRSRALSAEQDLRTVRCERDDRGVEREELIQRFLTSGALLAAAAAMCLGSLCTGTNIIMLSVMAGFIILEELKHLWLLGSLGTEASGRRMPREHVLQVMKHFSSFARQKNLRHLDSLEWVPGPEALRSEDEGSPTRIEAPKHIWLAHS
ncbi:hypothetical protein BCR43DRAFT_505865 [Syncephalastrum racemosum]|uniref:Uncharacterized protein n=1 Tax=Syncephalastrum racemosum TaxID=13706 RepID=A0A1X2HAW6_SYNRA|nr:hypothetical protein BCR43DRAFT_505865 [Syncephalastrum racemosum]